MFRINYDVEQGIYWVSCGLMDVEAFSAATYGECEEFLRNIYDE